MRHSLITIACWLIYTTPAQAITLQQMTEEEAAEVMQGWKPLKVKGDAIPWEILGQTKEVEECRKDKLGEYCLLKPEYAEPIKSYDGKEVTLMGYMFPLEQTEKQKNFLLGPFPPSCPFHYHVGPSQTVEVILQNPMKFSFEPITLKGKLSLRYNEETGMFYYLDN
jgi:hypothetical protein